jgi:hypothetical protein
MWKIIGGVFIGVFVGALAVEVVKRLRPSMITGIEDKAEKTAKSFLDSFKEGYRTSARTISS